MSTPEQPDTPPLTRKQLRELRNTGATPIIPPQPDPAEPESAPSAETAADAAAPAAAPAAQPEAGEPETVSPEDADEGARDSAPEDAAAPVTPSPPVAPLPRAAEAAVVAAAPVPDASVDLGVAPLTRRQARQQERIRTASVPVITPDFASQYAESAGATASASEEPAAPAAESLTTDAPTQDAAAAVTEQPAEAQPAPESDAADDGVSILSPAEDDERAVVSDRLGADLLAAEPVRVALPPTFDQLISRDATATGSTSSPNALILSQTPSAGPLTAPIASTGEVLITGTFELPEGLGSTGHAPGVADGKEVDAVLVDGELPAHSSPTPIAASAAISTVKTDGEIIRPPAPEKGNKLMLTLAITAGALALALVGVLILAFVTGVFS